MRFDTVIIGGGLSGLLAGMVLSREGKSVAIVSAGQSALHFCSGSFELYGKTDNPMDGISALPKEHPYSKLGLDNVKKYARQVKDLFNTAGIKCSGDITRNHYRLTPIGVMKPAWLTLDDYACFDDEAKLPWRRVALVNFEGYLDFHPKFLKNGFMKRGVDCDVHTIELSEFKHLRESSTEMRATNIARVMTDDILRKIARNLKSRIGDAEAVFMPAAFGMYDTSAVETLRSLVRVPVYFVPTMPASVPGVRTQIQLRQAFQHLGGVYMLGDNVKAGTIKDGRLCSVTTVNHGDMELKADNFVLASGSFFSHGLIASQDAIYEPILGLDIKADASRAEWYDQNLYAHQPYMGYGVITDDKLRCMKDGQVIENLYAAGSVLADQNSIEDGTGGGVAITTALFVADEILKA